MTVHGTRDLEQITSREQPQTQGLTPAQPITLISTRIPFQKGTVCTYPIPEEKEHGTQDRPPAASARHLPK